MKDGYHKYGGGKVSRQGAKKSNYYGVKIFLI